MLISYLGLYNVVHKAHNISDNGSRRIG